MEKKNNDSPFNIGISPYFVIFLVLFEVFYVHLDKRAEASVKEEKRVEKQSALCKEGIFGDLAFEIQNDDNENGVWVEKRSLLTNVIWARAEILYPIGIEKPVLLRYIERNESIIKTIQCAGIRVQ